MHNDKEDCTNLYNYTTPNIDESFATLLQTKQIKIVRIVSSDRVMEKEYLQEEDEWVVVLEGEATLQVKEQIRVLKRGDCLFIPAHTPHCILKTHHGTLWLAVHIYPT